jgi:hypothetical protein
VANVSHGIGRHAASVLIDLVGVQTPVKFGLLFRGEPKCLLISGDTVPQVLYELDSLFDRELL